VTRWRTVSPSELNSTTEGTTINATPSTAIEIAARPCRPPNLRATASCSG
jgi:hypothetical protein